MDDQLNELTSSPLCEKCFKQLALLTVWSNNVVVVERFVPCSVCVEQMMLTKHRLMQAGDGYVGRISKIATKLKTEKYFIGKDVFISPHVIDGDVVLVIERDDDTNKGRTTLNLNQYYGLLRLITEKEKQLFAVCQKTSSMGIDWVKFERQYNIGQKGYVRSDCDGSITVVINDDTIKLHFADCHMLILCRVDIDKEIYYIKKTLSLKA